MTLQNKLIIITIGTILAIEGIDATALNIAFPSIAASFHTSPLNLKLALTSYLLAQGLCIPLSSWTAVKFDLNLILMTSVIIFGLSSIMCGISNNLSELITFRVIQGGSASFAIPIGRLIIAKVFNSNKRSQIAAIGSVMAISLTGNTIGPVLGGIVTDFTSWRWIFVINLPIAILCIYMIKAHLPRMVEEKAKKFDYLGYMMICGAIGMFFLFFDGTVYLTAHHAQTTVLFILGLIFLSLYICYAKKNTDAIFPLAMFTSKEFLIALFSNFTFRLIFGSVPFILSLLLQTTYRFSAYNAGLFIAVVTFGMIIMKKFVGFFVEKIQYKKLLIFNSITIGLITIAMAYLLLFYNLYYIVGILFLYGMAISLQYSIMNVLGYANMIKTLLPQANAVLNMARLLGTNCGIAIAAMFISSLDTDIFVVTAKHYTYLILIMSIIAFINASVFLFLKSEPIINTH